MVEFTIKNGNLVSYSGTAEVVKIPNGVKAVGDYAFSGCTAKTVFIPASVEYISVCAFKKVVGAEDFKSNSIERIEVCESSEYYTSKDGVLFNKGKSTLFVCPDKNKGNEGVYKIPESVVIIGESAFCNCTELTNIIIPDGIMVIDDYVFNSCTKLKEMVVPDSVVQIFNNAFENCTGLKTVTIGSSIKGLGSKVFNGCSSLKSVIMKKVPSMYDDDLYTANPNLTIYYRIA